MHNDLMKQLDRSQSMEKRDGDVAFGFLQHDIVRGEIERRDETREMRGRMPHVHILLKHAPTGIHTCMYG